MAIHQPTNLAVRVVEALEKYADLITKPDTDQQARI
jgi:hypothetical protein